MGPARVPYTQDEDALLMKYIATYNPEKAGRLGNELYRRLVENAEEKWPWAHRHSWQSWRDRYKKNEDRFDAAIKKYLNKKKGKQVADEAADPGLSEEQNGEERNEIPRPSIPTVNGSGPSTSRPLQSSQPVQQTQTPQPTAPPAPRPPSQTTTRFEDYLKAKEADATNEEEVDEEEKDEEKDEEEEKEKGHEQQEAESKKHKHIARKTARKTALLIGPPDDDEENIEIEDVVVNGQAFEHENEDRRKRKFVEESDSDDRPKRRKIRSDARRSISVNNPKAKEASVISPDDVEINPTDQARINSVGLQFFIKSMAENHGISEEWVWNIYKDRKDLEATDRILARMHKAAQRACTEALERDDRRKSEGESVVVHSTPRKAAASLPASKERAVSRIPEIDLTALSVPSRRSISRRYRRRSELQYTPGNEDATLARLREQYAPPSASRAARYLRTTARRSTGMMDSPLNPKASASRVYEDEDSEKEEIEVSLALTPRRLLDFTSSSKARAPSSSPPPPESPTVGTVDDSNGTFESQQPWSADEDKILRDGEDEKAIKDIVARRGHLAVKWRMVELNEDSTF